MSVVRVMLLTLVAAFIGAAACLVSIAASVVYGPKPPLPPAGITDWTFDAAERVLWLSGSELGRSYAIVSFRVYDSSLRVNPFPNSRVEEYRVTLAQAEQCRQGLIPQEVKDAVPAEHWSHRLRKYVVHVERFGVPFRCFDLARVIDVTTPNTPAHVINAGSKRAFDTTQLRWGPFAANVAIFTAAAWPLTFATMFAVRAIIRTLRARSDLCRVCAHPVLPEQAVCPECGTPAPPSCDTPPPAQS